MGKEVMPVSPIQKVPAYPSVVFLLALAGLVPHRAARLASRLAGCLTLSTATLLYRVLQTLRIQSLNMLHLAALSVSKILNITYPL